MTNQLPTVDGLKGQARRLRQSLSAIGKDITHSQSLELLAGQYGGKDWNTLYAMANSRSETLRFGVNDRVSGEYLGQPFTAKVIGLKVLPGAERFRLTLRFDKPVDVVTHDSFSALRTQVTAVVDRTGQTRRKTSDGRPHLRLAS